MMPFHVGLLGNIIDLFPVTPRSYDTDPVSNRHTEGNTDSFTQAALALQCRCR